MKPIVNQHGSVLIELALLLPPLLLLAFGVTEFGRAMYQYNAIAKSVRDGARHISQFSPGDPYRIEQARSLVVFGCIDEDCEDPEPEPLVAGMTTSHVRINDRFDPDPTIAADHSLQPTGRGTVNLVSVEVSGFQFVSMAPAFVPNFTFDPIRVTMVQVL